MRTPRPVAVYQTHWGGASQLRFQALSGGRSVLNHHRDPHAATVSPAAHRRVFRVHTARAAFPRDLRSPHAGEFSIGGGVEAVLGGYRCQDAIRAGEPVALHPLRIRRFIGAHRTRPKYAVQSGLDQSVAQGDLSRADFRLEPEPFAAPAAVFRRCTTEIGVANCPRAALAISR